MPTVLKKFLSNSSWNSFKFQDIGYTQLSSDSNVLLKYISDGCWILVLVYVDDLGLFVIDTCTYGSDDGTTGNLGPLLSELLTALIS